MAADARFCIECGATVKDAAAAQVIQAPPSKPTAGAAAPQSGRSGRARSMALAVVGLLALAMIGYGLKDSAPTSASSPTPSASSAQPAPPSPPPATAPTQEPVAPPPTVIGAVGASAQPAPPPEQVGTPTGESAPFEVPAEVDIPGIEPLPLFETQGDLNSDGSLETVRVIPLKPGAPANSNADKQILIAASDGSVVFKSLVFQEPFRTDLDDMAESPDQKAGLHILESQSGYPVIRVIFVCRSGNFVDFQFDGQTYAVLDTGN